MFSVALCHRLAASLQAHVCGLLLCEKMWIFAFTTLCRTVHWPVKTSENCSGPGDLFTQN